jgi:cbb3-type cytochrome oxidase subunit 3
MPIHPLTPHEAFIEIALQYLIIVLFIVVPALTAFWAWSAYRSSKKIGYVWLAVFALTPYFTFALNKVWEAMHQEEIATMNGQLNGRITFVGTQISFPIYLLAFAAGVFFLYRAERKSANKPSEPTPTSVTPAADAPVAPPSGAANL